MSLALDPVRARGAARTALWIAWGLAGAAGVAAVSWLSAHGAAGEPLCMMRRLFHVSCPTCGVTRALALLARGELGASLALHPWAAALALQAFAAWGLAGLAIARGPRWRPDRWLPHAITINGIALAGLWLIRCASGTLPGP